MMDGVSLEGTYLAIVTFEDATLQQVKSNQRTCPGYSSRSKC
jgi:hypothetical protein